MAGPADSWALLLRRTGGVPWWFLACAGALIVIYWVLCRLTDVSPDSPWGLTFGTTALVLLVGAAAYAGRRRLMRLNLGPSRFWLQFHIWGGLLFLLTALMHSGFSVPVGQLNRWLLGLSVWTGASGVLGLLIQRWIPKVLTSGLSLEAHYDRIPALVDEIRERSEALVAKSGTVVQEFYAANLAPALVRPEPRFIYVVDITGGIRAKMRRFDYLEQVLGAGERAAFGELRQLYLTKLELDAHSTLQRGLRWWIYLHAPLSFLLLVLVAIHLWMVAGY